MKVSKNRFNVQKSSLNTNKTLLIAILSLFSVSCCTSSLNNNNTTAAISKEEIMLSKVRNSILRISIDTKLTIYDKITHIEFGKETSSRSGSGSVIGQLPTGSLILTAAHVCDITSEEEDRVRSYFPFYMAINQEIISENVIIVTDINGKESLARVMVRDIYSDTCILFSTKVSQAPLPLSEQLALHKPSITYTFGFPFAIWDKDMIPFFKGFYLGDFSITKTGAMASAFGTPAVPGVSGGPIVDINGDVIGLVHAFLGNGAMMPSGISLGATPQQVRDITKKANELYLKDKVTYDVSSIEMFFDLQKLIATRTSTLMSTTPPIPQK